MNKGIDELGNLDNKLSADIEMPKIEVKHQFDVIEEFDKPQGKFGDNIGNVGILDCKYMSDYVNDRSGLTGALKGVFKGNALVTSLLEEEWMRSRLQVDLDFCNYAMMIVGVVNDQVSIYSGSKQEMN
mmetsp:Transcript_2325/g.3975  ORF Transcript_2325/g.3975 Transcript_2325/m.3975 type:complete len:128 (-) Transcript_2325:2327-2710(-)